MASDSSLPDLPPKFTPANGMIIPSALATVGAIIPSKRLSTSVRLNAMQSSS
jgi:hypothetical protein